MSNQENAPLKDNTEMVLLDEVNLHEKEAKLLSLGTILGNLLVNETGLNDLKVKLNLSGEYLDLLKKISEMFPDLLGEIDVSISEIVADKVIDSSDVPRLIVLIKNVYKKFSDTKKLNTIQNITLEDSINFIKNLLLILIELEHIKVNDKANVLLIIDLCVDLLTTSIDVTDSLVDKIKSCFKKCC